MTELSSGNGSRGSGAGANLDLEAVSFGPFSLRSRMFNRDSSLAGIAARV